MSKLESFIRRMQAQRDCLNHAAQLISAIPGPVFELGLGNGRTYDHLRQIVPDRKIYAFDRRMAAYRSCTPSDNRLFLGEVSDTLPQALKYVGEPAALIHMDLGTTDKVAYAKFIDHTQPIFASALRSGGIFVSDHPLTVATWDPLDVPSGVKPGRYFLFRAK